MVLIISKVLQACNKGYEKESKGRFESFLWQVGAALEVSELLGFEGFRLLFLVRFVNWISDGLCDLWMFI